MADQGRRREESSSGPYLRGARARPTADDFIRHLEHAIEICGEDHVASAATTASRPMPLGDEAFEKNHAAFMENLVADGVLTAAGARRSSTTFIPASSTMRDVSRHRRAVVRARPQGRAHREDPRRNFGA
jgi:hypothetical protein